MFPQLRLLLRPWLKVLDLGISQWQISDEAFNWNVSNQVQGVLRHNMLTTWTYEVRCGWLHGCNPGRYPTQWQCITPMATMMMSWILSMVSSVVPVTGLLGRGSSSRLSLPHLNSAAHFFTMLYEVVSYPNVNTMSWWISLGVKPLRLW